MPRRPRGREKRQHFDAEALLNAVQLQPIGLNMVTNHPAGFKRLLYLTMRKHPLLRCTVLQSPASPTNFYLVRAGYAPPEQEDPTNSLLEAKNG